ncbi:hypothetical protein K469DRAFT_494383, partial [Zopfia rhizophila CBS 207.26]
PALDISFPKLLTFFHDELPDFWLAPLQPGLKGLTLYAYQHWGKCPKLDFRCLYFKKLESLMLRRYTFTHDWQLDWILLYHSTLRELVFDSC